MSLADSTQFSGTVEFLAPNANLGHRHDSHFGSYGNNAICSVFGGIGRIKGYRRPDGALCDDPKHIFSLVSPIWIPSGPPVKFYMFHRMFYQV